MNRIFVKITIKVAVVCLLLTACGNSVSNEPLPSGVPASGSTSVETNVGSSENIPRETLSVMPDSDSISAEINRDYTGSIPEEALSGTAGSREYVRSFDLSDAWILKPDADGNYVIQNKTTGKLLSIAVSEPDMPEQVETFITAVGEVYQTAHDEHYTYGDSRTLPPCEDHLISCDRMIARALWNLGYTDQITGGMTIGNEDEYLTSHGFRKLEENEKYQRGDIVLYERAENGSVSHTCVLTGYNAATGICSRYDCGGTRDNPRFARIEPIVDPVVYQYDYEKRIRAVYRFEDVAGEYDSSVSLEDCEDTNELSQRWTAEPSGSGTYFLRAAIDDSLCISENDGILTLGQYPEDAANIGISMRPKT